MKSQLRTAALVLAAGSSSRMADGQQKLLLPLGNQPVLAHVLTTVFTSQARPIILVLGHRAEAVRTQLRGYEHPALSIIENPAYQEGMSSSLRSGIQVLLQQPEPVDSVLILLGDQPLMTSAIIDTLIAARRTTGRPIVAPLYQGERGNPVLFAAELFPELLTIRGDQGARAVLQAHRQEMLTVEMAEMRATYDVDTWDAYQQVVAEWQRAQEQSEDTKQ